MTIQQTCCLYQEWFPHCSMLQGSTFSKIHQHLRDTTAFGLNQISQGRPRSVSTPHLEEKMLHLMEQKLGTSMRTTTIKSLQNTATASLSSSNVQGLALAFPQEPRSADGIFPNVQMIHLCLMFCTLMKHDFYKMALPQYSNENPTCSSAVKASTLIFINMWESIGGD